MTAARSSSRVAKVDAGNGVAKKDVVGRVVEPLAPVSASSSGIAMLAQAKLSVGRVDDPAELEADQMAQKFSQWNGAGGSVEVSEGSSGGDAMRSADTGTLETGGFEVGADVQSEISSRSGRGVPLADDQRSKFEQFFGKDLSAVRVHADSDASELSGSLGAEAFTVGNDVYFGSGRYQSGASDKLLAHELTHVVQQNSTINRRSWLDKLLGRNKEPAPAPAVPSPFGDGTVKNNPLHNSADSGGVGNYDNHAAGRMLDAPDLGESNYDNHAAGRMLDAPDLGESNYDNHAAGRMLDAPDLGESASDAGSEPLYPDSGEMSFPMENQYDSVPALTGFGKRSNLLRGNAPGGTSDSKGYEVPVLGPNSPERWKTPVGPNRAQKANLGFNPWAFTGEKNRAGGLELPKILESESDTPPVPKKNNVAKFREKYPIGEVAAKERRAKNQKLLERNERTKGGAWKNAQVGKQFGRRG